MIIICFCCVEVISWGVALVYNRSLIIIILSSPITRLMCVGIVLLTSLQVSRSATREPIDKRLSRCKTVLQRKKQLNKAKNCFTTREPICFTTRAPIFPFPHNMGASYFFFKTWEPVVLAHNNEIEYYLCLQVSRFYTTGSLFFFPATTWEPLIFFPHNNEIEYPSCLQVSRFYTTGSLLFYTEISNRGICCCQRV